MRTRSAALFVMCFVLAACWPGPERLNFAVDGRILCEVYEGNGTTGGAYIPAEGQSLPIRIEAVPAYADQMGYVLTGTLTPGKEEPVSFEGAGSGGDSEFYVLTSPPRPSWFEVRFTYKDEPWEMRGQQIHESGGSSQRVPWQVQFGPVSDGYLMGEYGALISPIE